VHFVIDMFFVFWLIFKGHTQGTTFYYYLFKLATSLGVFGPQGVQSIAFQL